MATKLAAASKNKANPLLIAGIVFGPVLILMGLHYPLLFAIKRPDWFGYGIAVAGTFLLILGLVMMLARQQHLERRLDELERLKN